MTTTTATLLVPDLSEWQGEINWGELVTAGYPAAIIRAYNGHRPDHQFTHNRIQAHAHGVLVLGLYAYLEAGISVDRQADEFCSTVGKLFPGEWLILDYEAHDLAASDVSTWIARVAHDIHGVAAPWLYTNEYLYRSEHLGSTVPAKRTWLAAYGPKEPVEPHELWQYTDQRRLPGVNVPADCSLFHGTAHDLLKLTQAQKPAAPGPTAHARYPFPIGLHPGGTVPSAIPLQRALKLTGWMPHDIRESDHYGPATEAAVTGFNAKHGLNSTGVHHDPAIGPHGWALLMSLAYGAN